MTREPKNEYKSADRLYFRTIVAVWLKFHVIVYIYNKLTRIFTNKKRRTFCTVIFFEKLKTPLTHSDAFPRYVFVNIHELRPRGVRRGGKFGFSDEYCRRSVSAISRIRPHSSRAYSISSTASNNTSASL